MKNEIDPGKTDVVILCGGKGERLQGVVKDLPKPMADINGRPFLDILIDYLTGFRFRRIILCIGYKAEAIKEYYSHRISPAILFSKEDSPLGTAGAIKNAEALVESDAFVVVNGDSFCPVDLNKFLQFHVRKDAEYSVCLAGSGKDTDCGFVTMDSSERVISFNERARPKGDSFINAGMYIFGKRIFQLIEAGKKLSLEYDIIPKLLDGRVYGYKTEEKLIDIGTPERYAVAKRLFNREK